VFLAVILNNVKDLSVVNSADSSLPSE